MSLFEHLMGADFQRLSPALRRFHRLAGRHVVLGTVRLKGPESIGARLLAVCLGAPQRSVSGQVQFELDAQPHMEQWTRYFPGKTMTSQMRLHDGRLIEHLGAAQLTFGLQENGGRLVMQLQGMRFVGVPCPRWLWPRIVAQETGVGDMLEFKVSAALPWLGVVTEYEGSLCIPEAAP